MCPTSTLRASTSVSCQMVVIVQTGPPRAPTRSLDGICELQVTNHMHTQWCTCACACACVTSNGNHDTAIVNHQVGPDGTCGMRGIAILKMFTAACDWCMDDDAGTSMSKRILLRLQGLGCTGNAACAGIS